MSLIQRAKSAWNAFMSRATTAENNYGPADELRNKNLNKSAEEMQQPQQKEPTEPTKKDEVNKSDE